MFDENFKKRWQELSEDLDKYFYQFALLFSRNK